MLNQNPNPKKVKRATEDGCALTQHYWRQNSDGTETEYEVPLYRCLESDGRAEPRRGSEGRIGGIVKNSPSVFHERLDTIVGFLQALWPGFALYRPSTLDAWWRFVEMRQDGAYRYLNVQLHALGDSFFPRQWTGEEWERYRYHNHPAGSLSDGLKEVQAALERALPGPWRRDSPIVGGTLGAYDF